jgi:hypothetical protein
MSNESKYSDGNDSGSCDLLASVIIGGIVCLAGYGLYKLVSNEVDSRNSIAGRSEQRLLEEITGRDM